MAGLRTGAESGFELSGLVEIGVQGRVVGEVVEGIEVSERGPGAEGPRGRLFRTL